MAFTNESERTSAGKIPGESGEDPSAERVQAIFEAAYPPACPSVPPSEALQRRVAEMAARHGQQAIRRREVRLPLRWAAAGGVLLVLSLLGGWPGGRASLRPTGSQTRLTSRGDLPPNPLNEDPGFRGRGIGLPRFQPDGDSLRGGSVGTMANAALRPGPVSAGSGMALPRSGSLSTRGNGSDFSDPASATRVRQWDRFWSSDWAAVEEQVRLSVRVRDDFVTIPFPRVAAMEDRALVAAVEQYRQEAAVNDSRLAHPVSVQAKAMAFSDLCERLSRDTGIRLVAGNSVADEKVTVFCKNQSLRSMMRQLSRPFGYTWLRSGGGNPSPSPSPGGRGELRGREAGAGVQSPPLPPGEGAGGRGSGYRYELVQDLKSQLLEEELRNRDRNQALIALEKEIERYRPYLHLTPDEALARSENAPAAEKALLKTLSGPMWAALKMYSRLSPRDLAAMRAGDWVVFSGEPRAGQQQVPPEVEQGVIQVFRDWRVAKQGEEYKIAFDAPGAEPIPLGQAPGLRAGVALTIEQTELGRVALGSNAFWGMKGSNGKVTAGGGTTDHSVAGISPTVAQPDNATLNAALEREPAMRARVTLGLEGKYPVLGGSPAGATPTARQTAKRVTTAEVLEALHRATGIPIVADYYTRLYKPEALAARNVPLFDALNRVADGMRLRWNRHAGTREAGGWLQFRTTSYYDDRRKEVPNRLLTRWAASRREHGTLTLDDLVEIAALPDAPLDAVEMAEGARDIWGLAEWSLLRPGRLRQGLRFLAGFTPAQRMEAQSAAGLLFMKMPLSQQQRFLSLGLNADDQPLESLDELAGAMLRVEYSQSGWYQWGDPHHPGHGVFTRWVVPMEAGRQGRRVPRPLVRERTKQAALEAVRRLDPELRQALLEGTRRLDPRLPAAPNVVEEDQIFPSQLDLTFVYIPGATSPRSIKIQNLFAEYNTGSP